MKLLIYCLIVEAITLAAGLPIASYNEKISGWGIRPCCSLRSADIKLQTSQLTSLTNGGPYWSTSPTSVLLIVIHWMPASRHSARHWGCGKSNMGPVLLNLPALQFIIGALVLSSSVSFPNNFAVFANLGWSLINALSSYPNQVNLDEHTGGTLPLTSASWKDQVWSIPTSPASSSCFAICSSFGIAHTASVAIT